MLRIPNFQATFNPDGTFVYTPNPGWTAPDSFTYQANGSGPTATAIPENKTHRNGSCNTPEADCEGKPSSSDLSQRSRYRCRRHPGPLRYTPHHSSLAGPKKTLVRACLMQAAGDASVWVKPPPNFVLRALGPLLPERGKPRLEGWKPCGGRMCRRLGTATENHRTGLIHVNPSTAATWDRICSLASFCSVRRSGHAPQAGPLPCRRG